MAGDKFVVLTVSDTCSVDFSKDKSGPYLVESIKQSFPSVQVTSYIVPDDENVISKSLIYYCDVIEANVVLTTGGTGFASRDVTPEATTKIIDKKAGGIETALLMESLKITPMAMMSRLVSGIRKKTLIINFPGSLKAVRECFDIVKPILPHSIALLKDHKESVTQTHSSMSNKIKTCQHSHHGHGTTLEKTRQRNSPFPMIEMDHAMRLVVEKIKEKSANIVEVSSLDSFGLVTAEDIKAKEPFPPFEASIKDGYACWAEDGKGPRNVCGNVAAGDNPSNVLKRGECVFINTGAPVPMQANCVVQIEDTTLLKTREDGSEEIIDILVNPSPGQDIRNVGSDIQKDEIVISKGTCIGPVEMGLLATVGVLKLKVYAKPIVGILSTGNELQPFSTTDLKAGHIRDSNKIMLLTLLQKYNVECRDLGIVHDERAALVDKLKESFQACDIFISTGGVSMGDRDLLKPVLAEDFGADIVFGRLNMRPGKPTTFATCVYGGKKKYIFALPGNPVSAFVTCNLLVIPALKIYMNQNNYESTRINVELDDDVELDPRPHYARATITFSPAHKCPIAKLTGNQISSRLMNSSGADVLIELPSSKQQPRLSKGTILSALLL